MPPRAVVSGDCRLHVVPDTVVPGRYRHSLAAVAPATVVAEILAASLASLFVGRRAPRTAAVWRIFNNPNRATFEFSSMACVSARRVTMNRVFS